MNSAIAAKSCSATFVTSFFSLNVGLSCCLQTSARGFWQRSIQLPPRSWRSLSPLLIRIGTMQYTVCSCRLLSTWDLVAPKFQSCLVRICDRLHAPTAVRYRVLQRWLRVLNDSFSLDFLKKQRKERSNPWPLTPVFLHCVIGVQRVIRGADESWS